MTKEEVISTLKLLKKCYIYYFNTSDNEAIDIAIKELEMVDTVNRLVDNVNALEEGRTNERLKEN